VSLTIGVAVATCVVVVGILAAPAIVDCSREPGGLGACLRGKLDDSGLLGKKPTVPVVTTAEVPVVVPVPRPRPAGWIEANATEYHPDPPAVAVLSGDSGILAAHGLAPTVPKAEALVALVEPDGILDATGDAGAIAPDGTVALAGEDGLLAANGTVPTANAPDAQVALAEPQGQLTVGGDAMALTMPDATVALAPPTGIVLATGRAPTNAAAVALVAIADQPGTLDVHGLLPQPPTNADAILRPPKGKLSASMSPLVPNAPAVAELTIDAGSVLALGAGSGVTGASALALPSQQPEPPTVIGDIGPQTSTDALATITPAPSSIELGTPPPIQPSVVLIGGPTDAAPEQPTTIIDAPKPNPQRSRLVENNPAYPDVLVLPPPNTGEHSSFGTLQLH
jgi:hypothetical protein